MLLNSTFNIATLLVVGIISFFIPILVSSWLGLDMFPVFSMGQSWITYSIIIMGTTLVVFFIAKRFRVFKSSIITMLTAAILASALFGFFAWFYFPHFNEKGFNACQLLATKSNSYDENVGYNLGGIDEFIKDNGKPSKNGKSYTYVSKKGHFCSLTVNGSGVIEKVRWAIP